jgi:hypothetical protein
MQRDCVSFPTPPPRIICEGGTYFDPHLSQCVRQEFPRCPLGHHWEPGSNRCVPEEVACPVGTRWEPERRACRTLYEETHCEGNMHWEPTHRRCEPEHVNCRPGFFWDPRENRCDEFHRH